MQILLLLISSLFCRIGNTQPRVPANSVEYHLSWDGQSTKLSVDLFYPTNDKDSTVFVFGNPSPGGLTNIFDILSNLRAGRREKISIDKASRKIVIHHRKKGISKLHYELDGSLVVDPKRARPNEAFRPTIAPGFFYSLGFNLFMDIADSSINDLRVVWNRWPKDYGYFISSDPDATPSSMQTVPYAERSSLLIQLNKELEKGKFEEHGIRNYLISSRADTVNKLQEQMKPFVSDLIPLMRRYWNDHEFDFYFISMIPLRNKVPSTMTGIGLINGFGTRYSGPLDMDKTSIIAHEISHTWIGVKMKIHSTGMENTWFGEGFNDYVAQYNLVQAAMYTVQDFVDYTNNEVLRQYYLNPENQLPGDSIETRFWTNKNVEKIPYHRGYIYAFYLDNQIRLASDHKYTLHDFLLALYEWSRKEKKQRFSIEEFAAAAAPFLPANQVLEQVKKYMLDGALPDFRTIPLIDAFEINYEQTIPVLKLKGEVDIKAVFR